jgi:hypothetical protein
VIAAAQASVSAAALEPVTNPASAPVARAISRSQGLQVLDPHEPAGDRGHLLHHLGRMRDAPIEVIVPAALMTSLSPHSREDIRHAVIPSPPRSTVR